MCDTTKVLQSEKSNDFLYDEKEWLARLNEVGLFSIVLELSDLVNSALYVVYFNHHTGHSRTSSTKYSQL